MDLEAQWIVKEVPQEALDSLANDPSLQRLPRLVRSLMAQRGIAEPVLAERFLNPRLRNLSDPFLIPNMSAAVDRFLRAIDLKESVVLYGDYDVDGVTSLALLSGVLAQYGLAAHCFLPHRIDEGYGISLDGIERCLNEYKPSLLVAVDCGTTAVAEIASLTTKGIDVIVCDHHEPGPELPNCVAVVNPKLGQDFRYLCSAGVVFKVAHAILKARPNSQIDLRDYLEMIALGTVADIVPLVDENRILVRKGLDRLRRTNNVGLIALKGETKLNGNIGTSDIGFRLGPRLNAAGRLDNAQAALDLLLTPDPSRARDLALELEGQNRDRQTVEQRMYREAVEMLEDQGDVHERSTIVLGSEDWHPGVVGIVASRLTRRFYRPCFVVAFDEDGLGKGSGRSVESISLVQALRECQDLLIKGGGHEMAAGLTIQRENFEAFCQRFESIVAAHARSERLVPKLMVDAETPLKDLTLELLNGYELLEPFGSENPQPVFVARGVSLAGETQVLSGKHLKMELYQGGAIREAIFFGAAESPLPPPPWDVAFNITRNEYRGRVSLQIHIVAIRPSF